MPRDPLPSIALADTIRFLILTLKGWASRKQFGEITITVQAGQIVFVKKQANYLGRVPLDADPDELAEVDREEARALASL